MSAPDTRLLDLITKGHEARSLLGVLRPLCEAMVHETLVKQDADISRGTLDEKTAYARAYEMHAYRNLVARVEATANQGLASQARLTATQHNVGTA